MNIFPAIDLYGGKAVRLLKGDYAQMTVYNNDPAAVAVEFQRQGAACLHLVDLEGAKTGLPTNADTIRGIRARFHGFMELGGGIRSMENAEYYLSLGIDRVILGTAAVTDPAFLREALARWGNRVAVGVDLKDGFAAIKGWTETSALTAEDFLAQMEAFGVATVICTDISRDGAMQGTNRELYRVLSSQFSIDLIASGGVSTLEDIAALKEMGLSGAIIGKAYYIGAIDLAKAIEVAK